MSMQERYETTRDNLFAASQIMPVVSDTWQIKPSQGVLKRGSLITEAGMLAKKTGAEATTAEAVYCVLAEDVDTGTGGAVSAPVYLTGEFNQNALIFNTAQSAVIRDFMVSARKVGIFFKPSV